MKITGPQASCYDLTLSQVTWPGSIVVQSAFAKDESHVETTAGCNDSCLPDG